MATSKSVLQSLLLIAAVGGGLTAAVAPAAVVYYSTDFAGSAGDTPTDWTKAYGSLELSGDGWYGPPADNDHSLSYFNPASGLMSFIDGTIEADFQRGTSFAGVVGRLQNSSNFYHVRVTGSSLSIYRFGNSSFYGTSTELGSASIPGFATYPSDETWNIAATFLGPNITATLRDSAGNVVQTLSVSDPGNELAGKAGVRGSTEGRFDDFTISNVNRAGFLITTADGAGADAYVENMTGTRVNNNYGGTTAVQLKNAGPDPNTSNQYLSRKTYLRFDLDAVGALDTQIAWLELTAASGTSGTYAFDVYGLLDGHAGEGWTESGSGSITWNNAPGNDTGSLDGVLGDDAVYLGQFATSGYSSGQVLQFGSQELIDFLNADTDGRVTLILTRFTHDDNYGGHSNSFHSKEGSFNTLGDFSLAPRLIVYAVPEPSAFLLSLFGLLFLACRRRGRRRGLE
ncbi:MAG: DNRLRE domain-containing protein [Thermoguttaceae bacterium]|jgi:hypothetical protein|nr:DNRLRE domain-containing protein [Thermoguttaceae bacterium]